MLRWELGNESGQKIGKSQPAMTHGKLHTWVEIGHGLIQIRQIEERIVAEAAGAMRSLDRKSVV